MTKCSVESDASTVSLENFHVALRTSVSKSLIHINYDWIVKENLRPVQNTEIPRHFQWTSGWSWHLQTGNLPRCSLPTGQRSTENLSQQDLKNPPVVSSIQAWQFLRSFWTDTWTQVQRLQAARGRKETLLSYSFSFWHPVDDDSKLEKLLV